MPSTQLSIKLGMDNSIFTHDVPPKVRRSSFPFGSKRDFCLEAGAIVPVDLIETVPGDSFELSCEYLLKTLPLVTAPFTSYRVRTHWYFCRKIDLWKGAPTLVTKGRSGNISLSYPKVKVHDPHYLYASGRASYYFDTPESLASYFGFAAGRKGLATATYNLPFREKAVGEYGGVDVSSSEYQSVPNVADFYGGVNALPFLMYQKIYRNSYVVPNLLQDNKIWFPDDISDGWRISYDKSNFGDVTDDGYNRGLFCPQTKPIFTSSSSPYTSPSPSVYDNAVDVLQLRFGLFEDDRFTTALPWAQRGTAPKIDLTTTATLPANTLTGTIQLPDDSVVIFDDSSDPHHAFMAFNNGSSTAVASGADSYTTAIGSNYKRNLFVDGSEIPTPNLRTSSQTITVSGLNFNLNQFRSLVALSVWQERNARTQGDYNATIYAHFGVNPRHEDFEPIYIGGTSDVVNFAEVIQTSETGTTPQGHETGLGDLHSVGNVGFFRCPDYGYIMGVMIIQPETIYAQKIDRLWLRETVEDDFYPEDEGLGLQEIFKGEIFPSGTSTDKDLFGYQERNTEYKTRDNKAIGWFGLPPTVDRQFSAMAQCRLFNSSFSINHQFCVMSPQNIRRDMLAVPAEPMFKCSFATKVRAHRPMAYKTVPQTFGF